MENENPEVEHSTIPPCLNNPTLGAAANGVFLDVVEAQAAENRRAEIEGRTPRIAKRDARYPGFEGGEKPSHLDDVDFGTHFSDGEKVMAPQSGPIALPAAWRASAPKGPRKGTHGVAERSKGGSGTTTQTGGSTRQAGTQTPSQASEGKSEHS